MRAETRTIKNVFKNDTLIRIPFYQRRYVWNEEKDKNWSRFCTDMESTMDSNKTYFLGSLILKEEDLLSTDADNDINKRCELVDGQQRLTTLAIYMKILHMMTSQMGDYDSYYRMNNSSKSPIIEHNCDDRPAFNHIIALDAVVRDLGIAENQLTKAYDYFRNRFEELRNEGKNLNELRRAIYRNVKFVVIELTSEDNEQQIFDTINSLGVDLTTDELLKNYLYKAGDEAAYANWRNMFDLDSVRKFWGTDAAKSRQEATRNKRVIDKFLHAFVKVKMWDFALEPQHKKEFVKEGNVYSTCQAFVEHYNMNRQALANEILEYAAIFKANFSNDILDKRIPMYSCVERIACYCAVTGNTTLIPYMLYVLKKANATEVNKICEVLETYVIRRRLANTEDKMYSDLFSENLIGGQHCLTAAALKQYLLDRDSKLAVPTNTDITTAMVTKSVDETFATLVYYLYETKLHPADSGIFDGGFNDYNAKQLMPIPGTVANTFWTPLANPDDEAARKVAIKTLGNFFMMYDIETKTYGKCEKKDLGTKKPVMMQWIGNVGSSTLLTSLTNWEVVDIETRTLKLASNFAVNIWHF